ncbi:type II toxin-antitoxin system RelE/ParE family toxin [Streptosporangium lutulentum]|uniref:Addiction module toxin RelE n=1 Tax=Streptosporangium lutulentum TaxID=1461250 RepID=A0ABT9QTN4_9ACTN|nr:type II toxin-antitoxin system RelE/ParE family toxin [Streptosporangium lutulentum]MDP9849770.1 hypothetical protein [Streptosporangium lutulentum]
MDDHWEIYHVNEVREWIDDLRVTDPETFDLIDDAIYALSRTGPELKRPLVGKIESSRVSNMKELRPGSSGRSEVRILFVFDPWRSAILLVAGDKAGNWRGWYRTAIPLAEDRYETYLKERAEEDEL